MSNLPEHHTRKEYFGLAAALRDAERVQADLLDVIEDRDALFVDPERVTFLARRALVLLRAAHKVALEAQ